MDLISSVLFELECKQTDIQTYIHAYIQTQLKALPHAPTIVGVGNDEIHIDWMFYMTGVGLMVRVVGGLGILGS